MPLICSLPQPFNSISTLIRGTALSNVGALSGSRPDEQRQTHQAAQGGSTGNWGAEGCPGGLQPPFPVATLGYFKPSRHLCSYPHDHNSIPEHFHPPRTLYCIVTFRHPQVCAPPPTSLEMPSSWTPPPTERVPSGFVLCQSVEAAIACLLILLIRIK